MLNHSHWSISLFNFRCKTCEIQAINHHLKLNICRAFGYLFFEWVKCYNKGDRTHIDDLVDDVRARYSQREIRERCRDVSAHDSKRESAATCDETRGATAIASARDKRHRENSRRAAFINRNIVCKWQVRFARGIARCEPIRQLPKVHLQVFFLLIFLKTLLNS